MFHRAHRTCAVLQNIGPEHTQMQSFTLKQWMYLWNSTSVCGFQMLLRFCWLHSFFFFFFLLFFVIGMLICSYYHRQTSCVSVRGSFKRLYLSINIQRFSSKVIPPWSAYCITSYWFLLCCLINGCILFGFFVYYSTALMNFKWCAMVRSLAWSATAS